MSTTSTANRLPRFLVLGTQGALSVRTHGVSSARRSLKLGTTSATRKQIADALSGIQFPGGKFFGDLRVVRGSIVLDALRAAGIEVLEAAR
jgi:hypothetical protein